MNIRVNVMAPLVVGLPEDMDNEKSLADWQRLDEHLKAMKEAGVYAVFTDIWWGLVEKSERQFDWRYYDRLSDHIIAAGLKWVPNISLHQCGGNIGDDKYIPLPAWVWTKLAAKTKSGKVDAVKFVSEQGHASDEYVSFWATHLVLDDYAAVISAFQAHFANKAQHIAEVTMSLGPAGELRYPSYNSHDTNTGFPTRGALQCYSEPAQEGFVEWVLAKYTDRDGVRAAWGEFENIELPRDVGAFYANKVHIKTRYGQDVHDYLQHILLSHGRMVMTRAIEILGSDGAPFHGIPVGAKFPGVHWRMGHWDGKQLVLGDRLAELAAGLIRTSDAADWNSDDAGRGYRPLISLFRELQQVRPSTQVILHFTCLEMPDGRDAEKHAESLARSLVRWVGLEARRQGVTVKGENALGWNLPLRVSWQLMRSALLLPKSDGAYEGITLLRMSDIYDSKLALCQLKRLCKLVLKVAQRIAA